ncbi:MAG: hypothetical protein LGB78_09250 [Sulfurovum sp.]|nr:hypothetical protein [Sulfurovum sp.]MCB4781365.1 hypothetical protein [Sulfurovum sp.]
MKKLLLALLLCTSSLLQASSVVPDNYYIDNDNNLTYIYAKEYHNLVPAIRNYQHKIIDTYTKEFGLRLDEKLYIKLASYNNQISGGSATPVPFNSQLLYGTGADKLDYFGSASWFKVLQIHESAHSFQLNAKENTLSKWSHKIFGNLPISNLGILPIIHPFPNLFVGSFLLEGNAVLNESRFGLGGRLYSGAVVAQNILLAKAGKMTPELMFNHTIQYPYRENWYFEGGMFQTFLVKKYGIEKVNGFFKEYSKQYFPFGINNTFETYYGKDFETLLAEFSRELKTKHKGFKQTKGKILATTQMLTSLTKQNGKITTLITDVKSAPRLLEINKKGNISKNEKTSFLLGRVFQKEGKYYTQSTYLSSPTRMVKGLYDASARLLKETDSKVVQGFKPNGKMIYMDVNRSLEKMHIYVGKNFYDTSSSRVLVDDKGDLYYFKQQGKIRTLYKNRQALFSYEGYYGYVTDVDTHGKVYIIAPSKHGTSAYTVNHHGQLKRITQGDDVVDLKVLDNDKLLVATMSANGFNYILQNREESAAQIPAFKYAFENTEDQTLFDPSDLVSEKNSKNLESYHALTSLKYSSLSQTVSYSSANGILATANMLFIDPLMRNSIHLVASKQPDYSLAGLDYDNSAYQFHFGAHFISVLDSNRKKAHNDYGYSAYVKYPFLRSGYWHAGLGLKYIQSFDNVYQKPLTVTLNMGNTKQYGISQYPNSHHELSLFASTGRGGMLYGASYALMHDIVNQSYVGFNTKYIKSDRGNISIKKGISINQNGYKPLSAPNSMEIFSLEEDYYAKEAMMAEVGLYKVFDGSIYFFSFPLSVQRESLYVKQRYYQTRSKETKHLKYHESIIGLSMDLLIYHDMTFPLNIEWVHNTDAEDQDRFRVIFTY